MAVKATLAARRELPAAALRAGMEMKDGRIIKTIGHFQAELLWKRSRPALRYDLRKVLGDDVSVSPSFARTGDLECGVPELDELWLEGDLAPILAYLAPIAVTVKMLVNVHGARIERGELILPLPNKSPISAREIEAEHVRLLSFGNLLARQTGSLPERLAQNVRLLKDASAREKSMLLLAQITYDMEKIAPVVALARQDEAIGPRVAAAVVSRDLAQLEAYARDERVDTHQRIRVLQALRGLSDRLTYLELARSLATTKDDTVFASVMNTLMEQGDDTGLKRAISLVPVVSAERQKAILVGAARVRDPNLETLLLPLERSLEASAERPWVKLLGQVGTVKSVPVLRARQAKASALIERALVRDIELAVAAIQSRLKGSELGQVSVIDEDGRLSVSADARGAVSVSKQTS